MNKITETLLALLAGGVIIYNTYAAEISATNTSNIKQHLIDFISKAKGKTLDFFVSDEVVETALRDFLNEPLYTMGTDGASFYSRYAFWHKLNICQDCSGKWDFYGERYIAHKENECIQPDEPKPKYLFEIRTIRKMILDEAKKVIDNPNALLAFIKSKEGVARKVFAEYAKTSYGKTKLQKATKYLDNVTNAIGVSKTPGFRKARANFLNETIKWCKKYGSFKYQDLPQEGLDERDNIVHLEFELSQITPDYNASMFVERRRKEAGGKAVEGIEEAVKCAREVVTGYLK